MTRKKKTTKKKSAEDPKQPKNRVSRLVSFILLVVIVAILGVVFYQVMARFLIPLFLSALLVVMFRPLHEWVLEKVNGRQQIGALLTTLIILLLVLVPVTSLVFMAVTEGSAVVKQVNAPKIMDDLGSVRSRLGLDMPSAREVRAVESRLTEMQGSVVLDQKDLEKHSAMFFEINSDSLNIAQSENLDWPFEQVEDPDAIPKNDMRGYWQRFGIELNESEKLLNEVEDAQEQLEDLKNSEDGTVEQIAATKKERHLKVHDYIQTIGKSNSAFQKFKLELLGGRTKATIIEGVNPTREQLKSYTESFISFLRDQLFALSGSITAFMASTMFGALIMIIGLYFFLVDGPGMLEALHSLSPIDDKHEQELVDEFARVSRAVVVATILSAAVQGLLAGIGFWFCGLESVFLLTLLSGVLAMVPFVGAAAVWVPCALYLFFVDNSPVAAIGLAIYGAAVISMADNVIKPWILHGQSNLHPLLALLSVIGGVAVLGPIGILVGPMIVVFLQTLLKILQREMHLMENVKVPAIEVSIDPKSTDSGES